MPHPSPEMVFSSVTVGANEAVLLFFKVDTRNTVAGEFVEFQIRRDSDFVTSGGVLRHLEKTPLGDKETTVSIPALDLPPPGTYDYSIHSKVSGGVGEANDSEFIIVVMPK